MKVYREIEPLTDKEKGPVLVRDCETQQFWVKKEYPAFLKDSMFLLQKIKHKNLPEITDVVVDGEKLFLYEEYIHGKTLTEKIVSRDLMEGKEILELALDILAGLEEFHNLGLVHRDIKPSNIMFTNDQVVKLIDFNAVRKTDGNKENDTVQLGTVGFAAPEQFGFAETDARSDLYSLGVVMNVCSVKDYPKNHLTEDVLIQRIVVRATKMDPSDRFQTVAEMKAAIEQQLEQIEGINEKEQPKNQSENKSLTEKSIKNTNLERDIKNKLQAFVVFLQKIGFFLRYIPGFRTKRIWKMFLALIGYFFIGMLMTSVELSGKGFMNRILWVVDCLVLFVMPIFLYTNFLGIHKHMPLLTGTSGVKKMLGYFFLGIIWFIFFLVYILVLRIG